MMVHSEAEHNPYANDKNIAHQPCSRCSAATTSPKAQPHATIMQWTELRHVICV